jgi:hypothetical protein
MPVVPAWLEAAVPLGIITAMLSAMGGLQGGVQHLFFGKPKLVGATDWDRMLALRDERMQVEAEAPAPAKR